MSVVIQEKGYATWVMRFTPCFQDNGENMRDIIAFVDGVDFIIKDNRKTIVRIPVDTVADFKLAMVVALLTYFQGAGVTVDQVSLCTSP